jgi:predicted nucleotidyltransferase
MVELGPPMRPSVFDYAGLKVVVADLFGGDVDVGKVATLKPQYRSGAEADALYAF